MELEINGNVSRIIKRRVGPTIISLEDSDDIFAICGCGLTRNKNGLCDGSHTLYDKLVGEVNALEDYTIDYKFNKTESEGNKI